MEINYSCGQGPLPKGFEKVSLIQGWDLWSQVSLWGVVSRKIGFSSVRLPVGYGGGEPLPTCLTAACGASCQCFSTANKAHPNWVSKSGEV